MGGDESSSATAGKTASELEGGRQDVAGPGQGREEEAGAGARHAGGGAATGAGTGAEARFSHRPSRPGRQADSHRSSSCIFRSDYSGSRPWWAIFGTFGGSKLAAVNCGARLSCFR